MPSLIVALSIVLAVGLIEIDATRRMAWMDRWPRLFGAGAEGARGMLSTIAGSMMTVVGVTFSMTLVALALASSQYTSRILRNFMSDKMTQAVLGIFAGIFTYCLIVLRTIRGGEEAEFVPSLSVSFAVLLAIGGVGILVYFIHHIASSIQASNIIAAVAAETIEAIDRLFPETLGDEPVAGDENPSPVPRTPQPWQAIPVPRDGYIQNVNSEALLRVAREAETVVRMERAIGEFVVRDTTLALLEETSPPTGRSSPECRRPTASTGIERCNRMPLSASDRSSTSRFAPFRLASTTRRRPRCAWTTWRRFSRGWRPGVSPPRSATKTAR